MRHLPFIELRRCATVTLEGTGVLTQCDGDAGPGLPLRIADAPQGLRIRLG